MPPPETAAPDPAELRRLFFRVFPAVGLAMFGAALDQTIVAAALPAIARSLGEVERVSWIVVAYLVATTIAAPVYGRIGDAFGRRRMLLVALGMYAAGAALCTVAPSLDLLALARIVQGFGGGGLISLSVALIAEVVPARERGRFQAYIAAVFAAASALGPVAGGVLTEFLGWRAVFLLQPPLALLAAILAVRRLRNAAKGDARGFAFDWAGLVLFALFVGPVLLALDQARRLSPGGLAAAAGLALLAGAALWLLWRQERRARDPLLPLGLLGEPSVWRANLLSALVSGAFVGSIAFMPIYFAAVRGLGPSAAGVALLPLAVFAAFGAMVSGRVLARTGRTMLLAGFGLGFAALLLGVVAFGTGRMPVAVLSGVLGLVSVGLGTSFPMVQVVVQQAAGRERLGSATASVQFTRSLGSAAGTALIGAVLFGALVAQGGGAAELFVALVNAGPAALAGLDAAAQAAFRDAMTGAFRAAFLCAAAMVAVAAWLTTRVPLQRV
ncbi:MFS transporter [Falsiroseomonas oryzae]|uniref:MFS transporter n=1 Tax=Falsiroseomonas oryzae TaxID=2766473 RepID=UPI0022EA25E6|nr:MFS transporter [Roseomonas sp. MO-31]